MSLAEQLVRPFGRLVVVGSVSLVAGGCVADFLAPVSIASHRYPSTRQAVALSRPTPPQQLADDDTGTNDRLPTAREIFDFHPRGSNSDRTRQPFLLDPNEGPLKISKMSQVDVSDAEAVRSRQSDDSRRMTALRPDLLVAPRPTAAPLASPLGHQ